MTSDKANSVGIWIWNKYDVFLEEVYGSGETDPIGELGIFTYILQMHIELMLSIRRKSSNSVPSMLGFKQCIWGCLYKYLSISWPFRWGVLSGNTPKPVEWGSYGSFGF